MGSTKNSTYNAAPYDVVVIGGGASGLLTAGEAAKRGLNTVLLEKNSRLGVKLRITGKGRCNLTNDCAVTEILENIPTGGRFLYSALNAFTPKDAMAYFENLGVPLKTERGGRVFPVSNRAPDIAEALIKNARLSGVKIKKGAATTIATKDGRVAGVVTSEGFIPCRAVVLCTGGVSYPLTGSTGDGYAISSSLGHTIIPPKPSLVPLCTQPEICSRMQGLALKNVRLTVSDGGKKPIFSDFGEMLFTHFGVSGPIVLSASAHMRAFESKKYTISIDLKTALDAQKLDARILRDFDKYSNRDFQNALGDLAPKTMIPVLVELSGIAPEEKVHSITRDERKRLVNLLKDFKLEIDGPSPIAEAIITSGGVATSEINPKTMASKIVGGLYFAGEIMDLDAYTGGFNLQIAWSTAYAAASHIEVE